MSKIEFMIVFVSIILGFNISEYLKGLDFIIKNRDDLKSYYPHTVWMILILVMLVQWWWAFWLYAGRVEENMGYFLLMLSIPMIYFISIALLIPTARDVRKYEGSLERFFHADSNFFYLTIIMLFCIYITAGLTFLGEDVLSTKVILRSCVIAGCGIAAIKQNKKFDNVALAITVVVMVYFVWVRF